MKSLINLAFFAALFTLSAGCIQNRQSGIRGEGPIVERKVNLEPIVAISLPGSADLFLTQGAEQEIRIEGQENIINNLNFVVRGEIWQISTKKPVWQSEPLKIFITLNTLKLIKISGSGDIKFVNHFTGLKDLEINISGSGTIDLDAEARKIIAEISGSGELSMNGTANFLDLRIPGSGSIDALKLTAQKAEIRISGSGDIKLFVEEELDASVSGSGSVFYKGNPRINSSISGSGSIRAK